MMNMSQVKIFCSDDALSDDELDDLFSDLLHVEPPPGLVEQILTSVMQLPLPGGQPEQEQEQVELALLWDASDGLVVHHNHLPPQYKKSSLFMLSDR
jgi:hypothetical protein